MLEKLLGSPKKAGSPRKPGGSPNKSPEKSRNPRFPKPQDQQDKITTKGTFKFCSKNVHLLKLFNYSLIRSLFKIFILFVL